MIPTRVRRVVERLLPWYDVAEERRRNERTEAIRQISIGIRIDAEHRLARLHQVRHAYRTYADGLHRR